MKKQMNREQVNLNEVQDFLTSFFEETLNVEDKYPVKEETKVKEVSIPQRMEETNKRYIYVYELPGIDKEKTNIEVEDNNLIVIFEKENIPIEGSQVHFDTIITGKFKFTLNLPTDIDVSNITANYQNGILRIIIPKLKIKKEKIKIK